MHIQESHTNTFCLSGICLTVPPGHKVALSPWEETGDCTGTGHTARGGVGRGMGAGDWQTVSLPRQGIYHCTLCT